MIFARMHHASAALQAVRAAFPFSLRGFLLTLLAAALLAAGLARADLAALFWGASFILYALYAIGGSHVSRLALRRRKRTDPDFVSILLPSTGLSPGETGTAHLSARLPRALPPGFTVRCALPLQWHDRLLRSVSSRLSNGTTQLSVSIRASRRGMYRSEAAILEIRDVLGFTLNRMPVPLAESLAVFPSTDSEGPWRILAEGDNPSASRSRRRRSEDLLEVRKYYPGDDVRRLNWKVFAHSRELFLRVGEETPPPESRLLFLLDTTANPLIPRGLSDSCLDGLVDSCAAAMVALASEGMTVLLCRPGARECREYSLEGKNELLSALADVWWVEAGWRPALPVLPRIHCAVFSTPGSPGLGGIMAQVRDRGWSSSLFLKEPPAANGARRLRVRDLLFVPAAPAGNEGPTSDGSPADPNPPATAMKRARAALSEALASDLAEYSGPGWKVANAREI